VGETRAPGTLRLDDAVWKNEGERSIEKGSALWPRTLATLGGDIKIAGQPPTLEIQTTDNNARTRVDEQKPIAPQIPPQPAPAGDNRISIDDFMKIDLRTAKVLAAEKVPNSRKLVKMHIDVGTEQRTLVAGIAEAYEPEQLVGRTIVMVFNLKPAKLMGIESNGMVLAASPDGGKPVLLGFDQEIPPGVRVR
jgi:methionine--tRNA ligase beta chain